MTMLKWVERGLVVAGVVLAAWSALTLTEAQFFKSLPVPHEPLPSRKLVRLPGEDNPARTGSHTGSGSVLSSVAPGVWIARLEAPSVQLSATVLEGTDDATLARAAGHIEETAFPGTPGNIGIAGHRDTTFRPVRHLEIGDPLRLTTTSGVFEYRIVSTTIVEPEDISVLDPTDRPTLTLVTCYPFAFIGHAPQRYIVKAILVEETDR